jgi:hypothetical protein
MESYCRGYLGSGGGFSPQTLKRVGGIDPK